MKFRINGMIWKNKTMMFDTRICMWYDEEDELGIVKLQFQTLRKMYNKKMLYLHKRNPRFFASKARWIAISLLSWLFICGDNDFNVDGDFESNCWLHCLKSINDEDINDDGDGDCAANDDAADDDIGFGGGFSIS